MNILLIGNGFDLAHGLPTKYTDFLEFVKMIKIIKEKNIFNDGFAIGDAGCNVDNRKLHQDIRLTILKKANNKLEKDSEELIDCINHNIWIEYFLQCDSFLKQNWIDFESEICRIIKIVDNDIHRNGGLDTVVRNISEDFFANYFLDNLDERIQMRDEVAFNKYAGLPVGEQSKYAEQYRQDNPVEPLKEEITYGNLISILEDDLNKLIRALEIYLCEYVEKLEIKKKSPDIDALEIDHVLSFNYTNTYEKVYGKSRHVEYDYIHGEADIDNAIESNNMVLGIDEYLPDDRRNKDIEFIVFKKYYQRIQKQTGCKYKMWVDNIRKDYVQYLKKQEEADRREYTYISDSMQRMMNSLAVSAIKEEEYAIHNLYIFGHSLDITDKDILCDLILNDNVHTTIFYLNKDVMGQQIANLVKVIGQDELIRRTGGNTKTIEFKLQQPMIPIDKLR